MAKIANKELYSQFLLAEQKRYSATQLSSLMENNPAHDTFTRWLGEVKLKPSIIWEYAQGMVDKSTGYIIIDDTVLDKWYARQIKLVKYQYSGTHHRIVNGIGLVNLLWSSRLDIGNDRAERIPIDFRIYAKKYDGKSKHQHCRDMLKSAHHRGISPKAALMDAWYADIKTFKLIREFGWIFISGIESNRQVSLSPSNYQAVADIATKEGTVCYLRAFGPVKVFKIVPGRNEDIKYLVANDLSLTSPVIRLANNRRWKIEEYHRGLKQTTGLENCSARNQRAQRNHILCSTLTFLALEKWRLETGSSWYLSKQQIIAHALKQYLKNPFISLPTNQASAS